MGVANVVNVYRKVYGCGIPTPGKLKNTGLITGTLEKIYQIGKADAGADRCRAGEIVGLVMDKYDTPGHSATGSRIQQPKCTFQDLGKGGA